MAGGQRRRRFGRALQRLVMAREQLELGGVGGSLLAVKRLFAGVMSLLLTMEIDLRLEIGQHLLDGEPCRHPILPRRKAALLRVCYPCYAPFLDRTRRISLLRAIQR